MDTQYSAEQYAENYPEGIEHYWWTRARNIVIHRLLRSVQPRRVIEVGCGRGVVVDYLRQRGLDCEGVELARVSALPRVADVVRTGTDAFALSGRERFDTLMLLDVLEHLPEPEQFVQQLLMAYPNAQTVLVTVPARPELWSNYDEHFGHFRRYTADTLRLAMEQSGLSVSSLGYFFHSLYPLARMAGKQRKVEVSAPTGPVLRAAHWLVAQAFAFEAKAAPSALPGTSLYAVCRVS